ncbi:MAG: hypothetical protein HZA54_07380 [Planctomycetes bacterium]|nr:hypothetical protein [Planctomycetota bacterium]
MIDAIVRHSDAIPYYIHQVVGALKSRGAVASAALAEGLVAEALAGAQDIWDLQHFRGRLTAYYGADRLPVVMKILDEVAAAEEPVAYRDLQRRVTGSLEPERSDFTRRLLEGDEESMRLLLGLLQRDHYLRMEAGTGRYRYRFPLIQRWWRLHRGLLP